MVKWKERPNYERESRFWRDQKGCFGKVKMTKTGTLEKHHVVFASCPGNYRHGSVTQWLDLWRGFKEGHLPFRGGLLDQPAKIMEAFQILDSLQAEKMLAEKEKN